ncbi:MAG TPA: hydrogenase maturation nickel metallochaperone HypA [Anaerolineae bacterium]
MHELGIAQEMIKVALEYAARNNATRITVFNIEISAAADESEDSLRFHFEHLTRGTIAEGAQIEITRVPVRAKCLACGNEFDWELPEAVCPRCASARIRAVLQDEFRLVSIDAE